MDIQPEKQNLNQAFGSVPYLIDFYQRDYKWTEEPIRRLLDDVFYQFDESYHQHADLEPTPENINARYPWYYLNTYVTNTVAGRVFVVDGQQRLTTLTLFLLKLLSMAKTLESETEDWLKTKIVGFAGTKRNYWMNHVRHLHVLEGLMSGKELSEIRTDTGITAVNMVGNYRIISADLDARLKDRHRFDTFVHYFLFRLVLINLAVDTTHVPMVFEVINDRGVRLKPYEILKGKLLGQIDKLELEKGQFNELWDTQLQAVNRFREDEIDDFFRYWLKAKFSDTRKNGQRFDGSYHREMLKADMNAILKLDHNAAEVKSFLNGTFRYFTNLYAKIWQASQAQNDDYPAVFFNGLNELDSQFMLILSACRVDDPEETEKIRVVSAGLDRMFSLLQLQGAYDSNEFAVRLFEVSADIREKSVAEIPGVFETHLTAELSERKTQSVAHSTNYAFFQPMSIDRLNKRFTRYFFGRVELLLALSMGLKMKHPLKDIVTSRGARNGFDIEHILSQNEENRQLFKKEGDDSLMDELNALLGTSRFDTERNRLGGVLLLKGRDNKSSSNERFEDKLKSYANSLYWNETLREDAYKSKLDFRDFVVQHGLKFRPLDNFGPEELEERHKLLFDLLPLIWPTHDASSR